MTNSILNTPKDASQVQEKDPLDVEELLVHGSAKAKILPDGRLVPVEQANNVEGGINLLKEREWGAPWYEQDGGRLQMETQIMERSFPRFRLMQGKGSVTYHSWTIAGSGQLYWIGKLRVHSGNIYGVAIVYPPQFPHQQALGYVIDPFIPSTMHRYADGHLCLYSNDHGGRGEGFASGVTTAATIVGWISAWLHAFEIYDKTGEWPERRLRGR